MNTDYDVVIVGAGPAGLFTALSICDTNKSIRVKVIDKGNDIYKRTCPLRENKIKECCHCSPCQIMSGFGGAGTFSDCKLSLTPFGVGGNIVNYVGNEKAVDLIEKVNKVYTKFDDDSDSRTVIGEITENSKDINKIKLYCNTYNVTYTPCPTKHLGTDGTYTTMINLYEYLISNGISFSFNTNIDDIEYDDKDKVYHIISNKYDHFITSKFLVIAPGRSGNTWLKQVAGKLGIRTSNNKVDIGVRVETDASFTKYLTDNLYDMKLSYTDEVTGNKIRTFCTNPYGFVSEEHYDKYAVANGHSFANKKSNRTNFALLVTLYDGNLTSNYAETIVKLINDASNNKIMYQSYLDFVNNSLYETKASILEDMTLQSAVQNNLNNFLPASVCSLIKIMIDKLSSITMHPINESETTILYGPEVKFYSDCIKVDKNFETTCRNLYAIGDGAGISRGITQAASCGLVVGKNICYKFNRSNKR